MKQNVLNGIILLAIIVLSVALIDARYKIGDLKAANDTLKEANQDPADEQIRVGVDNYFKHKAKQEAVNTLERIKNSHALADKDSTRRLYGSGDARISLKVFSDIECPYCRRMHPDLKRIVESSQGVINWEFKHFPLSMHNPVAATEALAIECIASEYNNQIAWAGLSRFIELTGGNGRGVGDIPNFARSFGLNGRLIELCLSGDSHKKKINSDYAEGRDLGISSTPAVMIVNNETGQSRLIKGYRTAEALLSEISTML